MFDKHYVIIVPGLGDNGKLLQLATRKWPKKGLNPIIFTACWFNKNGSLENKLNRLVKLIDRYSLLSKRLSLIGVSAGGSLILNAFFKRRKKIHHAITVCSFLRNLSTNNMHQIINRLNFSSAYAQSIILCQSHENFWTKQDKSRIMTIRAGLGDFIVPEKTAFIPEANNIKLPSFGHVPTIALAFTLFSKPMLQFLR